MSRAALTPIAGGGILFDAMIQAARSASGSIFIRELSYVRFNTSNALAGAAGTRLYSQQNQRY